VSVTVLDIVPNQLAHDRVVAACESLSLTTVEGDMADLSVFAGLGFDLIPQRNKGLMKLSMSGAWLHWR